MVILHKVFHKHKRTAVEVLRRRPYSEHYTWQVRGNLWSSIHRKIVFKVAYFHPQALVLDAGRTCPSPRHTIRIAEHTASYSYYTTTKATQSSFLLLSEGFACTHNSPLWLCQVAGVTSKFIKTVNTYHYTPKTHVLPCFVRFFLKLNSFLAQIVYRIP